MIAIRTFIIVDDDTVNNTITRMMIKKILGDVETTIFTAPEQGLAFIQSEYSKIVKPTILLLDINMPTMTGWEFVEQFEKFSEVAKKQIAIYILSSSIDQRDKDQAEANHYVKGFMSKPLTREVINSVASDQNLKFCLPAAHLPQ
jgi:CheY-like chemotaxis protein